MFNLTKRSSKRLLITVWAMLLLCVGPLSAAAAQDDIAVTIKLDGKVTELGDSARLLNGSLFVPVSRMAAMFGAEMKWNNTNEEATLHTAVGDTIVLGNGVPVVYFNETRYVLDTPPHLEEGRLYLGIRDMAELLHVDVSWSASTNTAELTKVDRAVVTEDYGLAEISKETGVSTARLLERNGLSGKEAVKAGMKLKVVVPGFLSHKAKAYTEEDLTLLAKITQVEAGYESYEGQLAIANVILNRVKDSRFPDTIKDVIYSGKQFPPAHNGLLDKAVPNASVWRAAKDALNGKNNVEDAVYFFNPKVSTGAYWSSLDVIVTIGNHSFAK